MGRLTARALVDAVGGGIGRDPLLVPLVGERGEVAVITSADGRNGPAALNPGNRYPEWVQAVAARSALRPGMYRPARFASRVRCPLLVLAHEHDDVAPAAPAVRVAERAPRGEVVVRPGGHYTPLLDGHEWAVELQLDFLRRQVPAAVSR
jgi:pimeloyl-ACP methyl ester carboxylesterase